MNNLNAILHSTDSSKQKKISIYVDNLHTPFILLDEEYTMPVLSNLNLSYEEKLTLTKIYSKFLPRSLNKMFLLPFPTPKKDTSHLCYIKDFSIKGKIFIFMIKIDTTYLGGTKKEKILHQATQSTYPSYLTDRIYFTSKVFPVKELIYSDDEIIDFQTYSEKDLIFFNESEYEEKNSPQIFSELFDDLDFKSILEPFKQKLKIDNTNWSLGKIYEPFGVEFFSIILKPLSIFPDLMFDRLQDFSNIFSMNSQINYNNIEALHDWLKSFKSERDFSPSGNIRWKITNLQ